MLCDILFTTINVSGYKGAGIWMFEISLYQQQRLKLAMTPELNQAITLLQYPAIELAAFIDGKALENPLIEIDEDYPKAPGKSYADPSIDQISEETITLKSYLKGQIPFKVLSDKEERILLFLIECIDENGYLRITFEEAQSLLVVSQAEWNVALSILQALEPSGVGARNLSECLLLQAKRKNIEDLPLEEVLVNHFNLLVNRKWKELAKVVGVSIADIQSIFDLIQAFNPKPGSAFNNGKDQYLIPDVRVSLSKGLLTVKVLSMRKFKPSDVIVPIYDGSDDITKKYMYEKKQELNWLKKAIEQREDTLRRVTYAIMERQSVFFNTGKIINLKPLTMKEVAKMVQVHESTVSRAIRDKVVETPFGTYEMKLFFSSSIPTNQIENSSSEQVKQEIVRLIKEEQKTLPLSDQAIAKQLQRDLGILISRRTIAKYRTQLHIPSSSKRKRYEVSE